MEEPTADPMEEPTADPMAEPTAAPTVEPIAAPLGEPAAAPMEEPAARPMMEPGEDGAYPMGDQQTRIGFLEVTGGYGFQLGVQPYVPTGDGTTSKHPLTNGFAVGGAAGWQLLPGLALMGNYEYARSTSRKGSIENALEEVQGKITYHLITVGLRTNRRIGPGYLVADFSVGLVLPFETELEYEYSPALLGLPTPIEGSGRRIHEYKVGFGASGQMGYQVPVRRGVYVGLGLKVQSFQSNDNGETLRLENFVTDFTAPAPVSTEIDINDDGTGQNPENYAVSSVRLHAMVGFRY